MFKGGKEYEHEATENAMKEVDKRRTIPRGTRVPKIKKHAPREVLNRLGSECSPKAVRR